MTQEEKLIKARAEAGQKCCYPIVTNVTLSPNEILNQLLSKIEPVDFAGVTGGDEVRSVHHRIYTIKNIVQKAEQLGRGLCKHNEAVYVFTGTHWAKVDKDDMKKFLGEAALRSGVPRFRADDYKFRKDLLEQFHSEAHLIQPHINKHQTLINVQNGTYEINEKGQRLREHRRKDFLTHVLPFEYQPGAKALVFMAFLCKVLPDSESQRALAEFVGYLFVRHLKLEKALLLYGSGANGKSVWFDVLLALLGNENASSYSLSSLTDSRNGYYRAMISDKLVNYASEINGKLETHLFKQIVSGEPVEGRLPYEKPFIMRHYAKLIFNANELPRDVEHTHAFFRRFLIIPFLVTIPDIEQDKQLAEKIISAELPGVLNWALEGLVRVLMQGRFSDCAAADQALEQYKQESDSVQMFVAEQSLVPSCNHFELINDVFRGYKQFCSDDNYRPLGKQNFTKRFVACGFEKHKKGIGWGFYCERPQPF